MKLQSVKNDRIHSKYVRVLHYSTIGMYVIVHFIFYFSVSIEIIVFRSLLTAVSL